MAGETESHGGSPTAPYKVAIVGSGPAGLSAAAHAARIGVSHILIERAPHLNDTIFRYQKRKHVMATPGFLPLRSDLEFQEGPREDLIGAWTTGAAALGVNVRLGAEVRRRRQWLATIPGRRRGTERCHQCLRS